jgi:PAS domain S-box-containing protein
MLRLKLPEKNLLYTLGAIFACLCVGVLVIGYIFFSLQIKQTGDDTRSRLSALSEWKTEEIIQWRIDHLTITHLLSENRGFLDAVQILFYTKTRPIGTRVDLYKWLSPYNETGEFKLVAVFDSLGKERIRVGDAGEPLGKRGRELTQQALKMRKSIFSELTRNDSTEDVELNIIVPLLAGGSRDSASLGAILYRIDPYVSFYPILTSRSMPGKTLEFILFQRDDDDSLMVLNDLRYQSNTAFHYKVFAQRRNLFTAALRSMGEIAEWRDYRGTPSLAVAKDIPGTPWLLLTRIDRAEAEGFGTSTMKAMLIWMGAWFVIAAAGFGYLLYRQRRRYRELFVNAEAERHALVAHFEYLNKYSNDCVLLVDADGRIVEANDRAISLYDYPREKMLTMQIDELQAFESRSDALRRIRQADEQPSGSLVYETMHRRREGQTFIVEVSIYRIEKEGRNFYQQIIIDVSEKKKAEDDLKTSEERSRRILESLNEGVVIFSRDWRVLIANQTFARYMRMPREHLIERKITEASPLFVETEFFKTFQRVMDTRKVEVVQAIFKPSPELIRWFEARIYPVPEGILCFFEDIHTAKTTELKLQKILVEHQAIWENVEEAMVFSDSDGIIVAVNPSLCRLFDVETKQVEGTNLTDFFRQFVHEDRIEIHKDLFYTDDTLESLQGMFKDRTGEKKHLEYSFHFIEIDGRRVLLLTAIRDATAGREIRKTIDKTTDRLTIFLKLTGDNICIGTEDGIIEEAGEGFCATFGFAREELLGKAFLELIAPADQLKIQKIIQWTKESKPLSVKTKLVRKNASTFDAEITILSHKLGDRKSVSYIVRDLSELKKGAETKILKTDETSAELIKQLSEQNQRLERELATMKQISKSSPRIDKTEIRSTMDAGDAVYNWDLTNNTLWRDENYIKKYDPSADAVVSGEWWASRLHPDDRESAEVSLGSAIDSRQEKWIAKYRFRNGSNGYVQVLDRGFIQCDENGFPVRIIGRIIEIG